MQIGPYLVQSELGRGGMGVVYEVVDAQGRSFALKRLRTESNTDDQLRLRRIGRELEALGRIQHPGVVRALDSGWDSGAFYIVMELVRSPSLGARVQRQGALPPREAAALCFGLAQTLHALHERGILHRDVKPDNVLVDGGRPRLTDLGLVQLYDEQEQLTQTGAAVGTPGFCAPELLSRRSGEQPTAAVDVYGLGATLYALLTGHAPFEGASGYEIAVKTLEGSPTPPSRRLAAEGSSDAERRAEVERFDELVLRCLAKDPHDRYRSAQDVATALEELMREEDAEDEAPTNLLLPLLVVIALGLLLGAVYAVLSPSDAPDLAAISTPPSPTPSAPSPSAPSPPPAAPSSSAPSPSPTPDPGSEPARVEDFLAPDSAPGPGPTPALSLRIEGPEDLLTLGSLASPVWKGRESNWELSKEQGGFIGLRSVPDDTGGISIRYFELRRNVVGQSLSARVTVAVDLDQKNVSGGLIYGRTDQRNYYLIGISNLGTRFVKHRTKQGLQDRISGTLKPGPHSFGINEDGGSLSISVDGRTIMGLGGAADPEARVGVFVMGVGLIKARNFEFELR